MKKWQPPIPAGALCSPDAIAINTALPLLGWCYDQVQRDGWLDIDLHEVAGAIEVPYHTVKKWWADLKNSSFITEVNKHGRNGMRVRLADDWLDWRSRDTQHSVSNPVPNTEQSGLNRDLIGTGMVPNMVPNKSSNKVLNNDQESEGSGGDKRPRRTPKKEPVPEAVIIALADACKIDRSVAPRLDRDQLYQSAGILARAGANQSQSPEQIAEVIRYVASYFRQFDWRGKKGENPTPAHIRKIWREAIDARAASVNGYRNGSHIRQSTGGNPERRPQVEADLDKPL